MKRCCVESCLTNTDSIILNDITFFDFPKCEEIEKFAKWVEALSEKPETFAARDTYICSRHFREKDFVQSRLIKKKLCPNYKIDLKLLENAVPSLHLPISHKCSLEPQILNIKTEPIDSTDIDVSCVKIEKIDDSYYNEDSINSSLNYSEKCKVLIKEEIDLYSPDENNLSQMSILNLKTENQCNNSIISDNISVETEKMEEDKDKMYCKDDVTSKLNDTDQTKDYLMYSNVIIKEEIDLGEEVIEDSFKPTTNNINSCAEGISKDCQESHDDENKSLISEENEKILLAQHLESYMKIQNLAIEKKFRCRDCGEKFLWEKELKRHKLIAHKSYRCHLCRKSFTLEMYLKKHFESKHENNVCTFCNKNFSTSFRLASHERLKHQGCKKYKCQDCHKVFFFNGEDSKHNCSKQLKCDICNKVFGTNYYLKIHKWKVHFLVEVFGNSSG